VKIKSIPLLLLCTVVMLLVACGDTGPSATPDLEARSTPLHVPTPTPIILCAPASYCVSKGQTYLDTDAAKAMEYFDEAIRLDPNDAGAYPSRGLAYATLGQYEKAIEDLTEAIRLNPNAFIYGSRGLAHATLGQYEKAIEDYTEAIRLDPNFAHFYFVRGLVYADLGQYEKALQDYHEAIRLDPGNEVAIKNRNLIISN